MSAKGCFFLVWPRSMVVCCCIDRHGYRRGCVFFFTLYATMLCVPRRESRSAVSSLPFWMALRYQPPDTEHRKLSRRHQIDLSERSGRGGETWLVLC
mmetsp:Transcript_5885/g.15298  ORF Transcript_5885/g.15298 Transcript_5885/m.15298 type:complete len:97 (+) Transcript_5885:366-656(+)